MTTELNAIGKTYKGFTVTKYLPIDELHCTLIELVHEKSGASIMHIASEDVENCFCLSFQTWPSSSNGVAHILEHTVLCGSRKFPVKDPFFSMTRRSLNTYMNALTAPDFTCYPASSQVEKDFYNLLEVYLDAVFHPELKPLSFLQEGHRLEFSEPENPNSPLVYKGVVFNEMKGAMTTADSRLWQAITQNLMPDLPYSFNSGGDPGEIPSLTYEELVEFHRNYYHPSHCLFYFYGNIPLKKHLDFIDKHLLNGAHKISILNPIKTQPRFSSPKFCEERFPVTDEASSTIAYGWLTTTISEQDEVLALCVLDIILMETDASLLKLELLRSGLCTTADSALEIETSETPWIIVCKGCDKDNADKIRDLIYHTLEKIAAHKIPQHLIDAAIHQLEFSRTEITGDNFPYGLTLFMRAALLKQHGCDAENGLMIHSLFKKLSERAKDPEYLPNLIRKHFLTNTHFVQLVMVPDKNLTTEEQKMENEILERIHEKLTEDQKQKILAQTQMLKEFQEEIEKQSLDCLPKVELTDVPKKLRDFPLQETKSPKAKIFHHNCFTNRVLYVDFLYDLPHIAAEDMPYLSLFASFLPEVGSAGRNYRENLELIHAYTGGIDAFLALNVQVENPNKAIPTFGLRGKCLYRNTEKLFQILKDLLSSADFTDKERLKELFLQEHTDMENRLAKNAMRYAISLSLSSLSPFSYIHDEWKGFRYYQFIQELHKDLEHSIDVLADTFERLKNDVLCLNNLQLVMGCDAGHYESMQRKDFFGADSISQKSSYKPWTGNYTFPKISSHGRILSSPVAFNSMAMRTVAYTDKDAPALLVATDLLENVVLHKEIREKGGAYGANATYSPTTGDFYFYSFRDPHLAHTIETFKRSLDELASGNFDDQDLEEAKLGIIQGIDSPVAPGSRAITAFYWLKAGKTPEMREKFRKKILGLTSEEIQKAVQKHLVPIKDKGVTISFAEKGFFEKENEAFSSQGQPPFESFPI